MAAEKYLFRRALRPFSFSVAVVVCLTGIFSAQADGPVNPILAVLILIAGLLLQAGVNLINDYSDLSLPGSEISTQSIERIQLNFRIGLICLLSASAIALYLIYHSGWVLLLYAIIGLLGALGYTLEPVNYKRRGLAVFFVFWLMGVLMVTGAYYVLTQRLNFEIFLISLPVSFYTSLLLLSNEIRDYEADSQVGIRTLSVRVGFNRALWIYYFLLAAAFISALLLTTYFANAWLVVLSLPIALMPLRYLHKAPDKRVPLTPLTGKAFLVFGVLYCTAIAMPG